MIARYAHSPYGSQIVSFADDVPPDVEQVTVEDEKIELSEESQLDEGKIRINVTPGPLGLRTPVAKAMAVAKTVEMPVQKGRRARKRIVITPTAAIAPGDTVDVVIDADGIQDHFLNPLAAQYTQTLTVKNYRRLVGKDPAPFEPVIDDFELPPLRNQ